MLLLAKKMMYLDPGFLGIDMAHFYQEIVTEVSRDELLTDI